MKTTLCQNVVSTELGPSILKLLLTLSAGGSVIPSVINKQKVFFFNERNN